MKSLRKAITFIALAFALGAGAQIQWLETSHNFGAIDESVGPVDCQFKFVNTSDEPYLLSRLMPLADAPHQSIRAMPLHRATLPR